MEFVQKFTPPDFRVKNFTLSILPYFSSFSGKKTQKLSENGEIYSAGKNFTLLPALTAWTNSTSVVTYMTLTKLESNISQLPFVSFAIASNLIVIFHSCKASTTEGAGKRRACVR